MNEETAFPKNILHMLSERKMTKRKTNQKMGTLTPGNLC
jgi:hypothetical protein